MGLQYFVICTPRNHAHFLFHSNNNTFNEILDLPYWNITETQFKLECCGMVLMLVAHDLVCHMTLCVFILY